MKRTHFYLGTAILVIPVIIFYMLNTGKQQYTQLPIYGEKIPPDGINQKDTIFYQIPSFEVINQNGQPVKQQDLNNGIYLANFFFASCKDVCPSMSRRLKAIYDDMQELAFKNKQLAEQKNMAITQTPVKFISFSVDPENDSVPILKQYANKFEVKENWYFVTTTKDNMFKIGRGFLLPVSIENKTIDHSQQIVLIDKQNRIRGMYDALDDAEMKRLKDEIKVLLYEYSEQK